VACFFLKMAEKFNWFRPGYELVEAKFEWNVQVPFLENTKEKEVSDSDEDEDESDYLTSPSFPTPEIPNSKWKLVVYDRGSKISIYTYHYNFAGSNVNSVEPFQVKMSILDKNGRKIVQQINDSSYKNQSCAYFDVLKVSLMKSECIKKDKSLIFCCKIFTHMKIISLPPADPLVFSVDCSGGLSTHLDGLFNSMQFSDVTLNIGDREFPAHKNILVARSEVFAAMFKHPMKEQSTYQIEIEDIKPDVFQELLRFIYTGRVSTATMETMAAGLFIAADKYLLDDLKMKCENYLLHHMTPDNCVVLLLHGDLQNPAKPLKEAAKFLRHFPHEVMATERWNKMKQENPAVLFEVQQFVLCSKNFHVPDISKTSNKSSC
jgi:speckle-type POZ protein